MRWNTGGAVWTTTSSEFKTFCETDDVTDRALDAGVNNSGWTAEEIQWGMTKSYSVDIIGVSRFLYSDEGVKFLKDQTASYFPYWRMKKTAVVALRSAIIADSIDGKISPASIMMLAGEILPSMESAMIAERRATTAVFFMRQ